MTLIFDIVADNLQEDTLVPYTSIFCFDNILWTSIDLIKENGFTLKKKKKKKKKSRWYCIETMTDADYTDDLALLTNTPTQAKYMLHCLELETLLLMGMQIKQFSCFKQEGATLSGKHLKLVNQFTYLSSNISSTESDINIHEAKTWTAINRLSIIWKPDLYDKIKQDFFQVMAVSILLYGCSTYTLIKHMEKKLDENYTRMLHAVLNKS